MTMKTVSIGVFAYNEEQNCAQILEALLSQECRETRIIEILVVSSACTDRTDEIVNFIADSHPIVRLVREPVRQGKAAAINGYLSAKNPKADVCVIASADILPDPHAVEGLALAISDPCIGMAGGRPIPVNKGDRFMGFVVQLQWKLHHLISLRHPKCGEMIAFRSDLAERIPRESPVDEASLEAITINKGLQLKYVPAATFRNRGPETVRDFIAQRRRIASGHRWLRKTEGYKVATGSGWAIVRALISQPPRCAREWGWTAGAVFLEVLCRLFGIMDFYFRPRVHQVWRIVQTTKQSYRTEELAPVITDREAEHVPDQLWMPAHEQGGDSDKNNSPVSRRERVH
ncbi:MAG: glycosyltransferase [Acidobacteria bacterium]|nr:glycosyltransferase [Acidobacteriota bacterium]